MRLAEFEFSHGRERRQSAPPQQAPRPEADIVSRLFSISSQNIQTSPSVSPSKHNRSGVLHSHHNWSSNRKGSPMDSAAVQAPVIEDTAFVRFWNEVLAPKFIRFKHILVDGLSHHSEAVFPTLPVREGDHALDVGCG